MNEGLQTGKFITLLMIDYQDTVNPFTLLYYCCFNCEKRPKSVQGTATETARESDEIRVPKAQNEPDNMNQSVSIRFNKFCLSLVMLPVGGFGILHRPCSFSRAMNN